MNTHALRIRAAITVLACLILTGCAHVQPPVPLDPQFWAAKETTIGVAITVMPEPELAVTGHQGILGYVINRGVNSRLIDAVEKWQVSSLNTLPDVIVAKLQAKGYKARRIYEPVDLSAYKETGFREGYMDHDMSAIKARYGVDRLLLLNVFTVGATRSYYVYIPLSVPKAQVSGQGMLIDLSDNKLMWFQPFATVLAAHGEWDEPTYSSLSKAFYQAVDSSRQQMITPFSP